VVKRGSFIVFEGIDGCGKSTHVTLLGEALRVAGHEVCVTREPTHGPFGEKIRACARSGRSVAPASELAWFVEDRRQHVEQVIAPALARGAVVVCDRYYLSTVAYQGARGLSAAQILLDSERRFPTPDLVLLLTLDLDLAQRRLATRGGPGEPGFESCAFQKRVEEIFRGLALPYLERIDAAGSIEQVQQRIQAVVRERLALLF